MLMLIDILQKILTAAHQTFSFHICKQVTHTEFNSLKIKLRSEYYTKVGVSYFLNVCCT